MIGLDDKLFTIIREAKEGSKEAFTLLMERYKDHVYRYAYGMLGDAMEAEDVAQETFIKAYYALSKLENEAAFGSWLTQIMSNICFDRHKKKKMKFSELNDLVYENKTEQQQLRLSLTEAIQKLSLEHREVILLKDVQGYSYDEMSEMLQIPLGTVKSRMNAARLCLRNELSQ
ncbi:MAG: RNA polymerase sigma factor [Paenibacillaceae bacterium]